MCLLEAVALPCPFIIAGVERPLEIVLSMSIRVLLMLSRCPNDPRRAAAQTKRVALWLEILAGLSPGASNKIWGEAVDRLSSWGYSAGSAGR